LEAEQEAGLKHLVLERKVAALSRVAEKKEAELCAALSASNIDQSAAGGATDKLQVIIILFFFFHSHQTNLCTI